MNLKDYIQKNNVDLTDLDVKTRLSGLVTEARLFAGISQTELAKRMSTTQSSIARAEGGLMEPSVEFLERVAKAVGTELVLPKFSFMIDRELSMSAIKNNIIHVPIYRDKRILGNRVQYQIFVKRSRSGSSFSDGRIPQDKLLETTH